jgi:hypothetical protein
MMLTEYSSRLSRLLAAPPAPGEGHRWMFRVAVHLRRYHEAPAVRTFLRQACDNWPHRRPPDREIDTAVANAFAFDSSRLPAGSRLPVDWDEVNPARIATVAASTIPLFSPDDRTGAHADDVLRALFSAGELVCLASRQDNTLVLPAAEAVQRGLVATAQFIVPSPMTAPEGVNKAGKRSARCESNTGPRRYLVLEFDGLGKQDQAAILSHLAMQLPLVLAVDSAGKSIHGWFRVVGIPDFVLRDFMTYAVSLGADPHTWIRCQLVRVPGGTRYRDDGTTARQEVVFVNP